MSRDRYFRELRNYDHREAPWWAPPVLALVLIGFIAAALGLAAIL